MLSQFTQSIDFATSSLAKTLGMLNASTDLMLQRMETYIQEQTESQQYDRARCLEDAVTSAQARYIRAKKERKLLKEQMSRDLQSLDPKEQQEVLDLFQSIEDNKKKKQQL